MLSPNPLKHKKITNRLTMYYTYSTPSEGPGHGTSINVGTRNLSILDCFMDRNLEPESRNRVENGTRNLVSWKYMI
jgi:hypothetical protein